MPPTKLKNEEVRAREYLRSDEVNLPLKAAGKTGRYLQRDRALILMYRHGLRVSEALAALASKLIGSFVKSHQP